MSEFSKALQITTGFCHYSCPIIINFYVFKHRMLNRLSWHYRLMLCLKYKHLLYLNSLLSSTGYLDGLMTMFNPILKTTSRHAEQFKLANEINTK